MAKNATEESLLSQWMCVGDAENRWKFDSDDLGWQEKLLSIIGTAATVAFDIGPSLGLVKGVLNTCLQSALAPDQIASLAGGKLAGKVQNEACWAVYGRGPVANPSKWGYEKQMRPGETLIRKLASQAFIVVTALLTGGNPLTAIPAAFFGVVIYFVQKERQLIQASNNLLHQSMVENWNRILLKNIERLREKEAKEAKGVALEKASSNQSYAWNKIHAYDGVPCVILRNADGTTRSCLTYGIVRDCHEFIIKYKLFDQPDKLTMTHYARILDSYGWAVRACMFGGDSLNAKGVELLRKQINQKLDSEVIVVLVEDNGKIPELTEQRKLLLDGYFAAFDKSLVKYPLKTDTVSAPPLQTDKIRKDGNLQSKAGDDGNNDDEEYLTVAKDIVPQDSQGLLEKKK
jgi:hypothetical protein